MLRSTTMTQAIATAETTNTTIGIDSEPTRSIIDPIATGTINPPIAAAPTIHAVVCADNVNFLSTIAIIVGY